METLSRVPVARVAGPRLHSSEMEPVVAQGFFPGEEDEIERRED